MNFDIDADGDEYGETEREESGGLFSQGSRLRKLNWTTPLAVAVIAALAYLSLTRGSESKQIAFRHFSSSESGYQLGGGTLFGLKGQTITVDYDLKSAERGHLRVLIWRKGFLDLPKIVENRTAKRPGKGRLTYRVPETGLYKVSCDGSPDGQGYQLAYDAEWHVE